MECMKQNITQLKKRFPIKIVFTILLIITLTIMKANAQFKSDLHTFNTDQDEMNIGGDIFSDFNEEIEAGQVMEDERFYRYGRFYSFQVSTGVTNFTGNRGTAYQNQNPSFAMSLCYFMDFQSAFGLGFGYSKHFMSVNTPTITFSEDGPGLIEVNMFRSFFFYRHYLDTSDLGTAITYSNPYFIGRLEYWNQTNKFRDRENTGNRSGGSLGGSVGLGLEFPIVLKESYFNVELLYHKVQFGDIYDSYFRPTDESLSSGDSEGFEDLKGDVITLFIGYVISW